MEKSSSNKLLNRDMFGGQGLRDLLFLIYSYLILKGSTEEGGEGLCVCEAERGLKIR